MDIKNWQKVHTDLVNLLETRRTQDHFIYGNRIYDKLNELQKLLEAKNTAAPNNFNDTFKIQQLESRISGLEQENLRYTLEIDNLKKIKSEQAHLYETEIKRLSRELETSKSNFERLTANNDDLKEELKRNKKKYEENLKIKDDELLMAEKTGRNNLDQIQKEKQELERKYNDYINSQKNANETLIQGLENKNRDLELGYIQKEKKLVLELRALKTDNIELENVNTELKNDNTKLKNDNTKLENVNTELKNDNTKLKNDNNNLIIDNTKLKNDITELKNDDKKLRTENNNLIIDNAELKNDNNKLKNDNNKLKDDNNKLKNDNIKLKNDNQNKGNLEEQGKKLEEQWNDLEQEKKTLEEQWNDLEQKKTALAELEKQKKTALAELEKKKKAALAELEKQKKILEEQRNDLEQKKKILEEPMNDLEQKKTALAELEKQKKTALAELEKQRNALNQKNKDFILGATELAKLKTDLAEQQLRNTQLVTDLNQCQTIRNNLKDELLAAKKRAINQSKIINDTNRRTPEMEAKEPAQKKVKNNFAPVANDVTMDIQNVEPKQDQTKVQAKRIGKLANTKRIHDDVEKHHFPRDKKIKDWDSRIVSVKEPKNSSNNNTLNKKTKNEIEYWYEYDNQMIQQLYLREKDVLLEVFPYAGENLFKNFVGQEPHYFKTTIRTTKLVHLLFCWDLFCVSHNKMNFFNSVQPAVSFDLTNHETNNAQRVLYWQFEILISLLYNYSNNKTTAEEYKNIIDILLKQKQSEYIILNFLQPQINVDQYEESIEPLIKAMKNTIKQKTELFSLAKNLSSYPNMYMLNTIALNLVKEIIPKPMAALFESVEHISLAIQLYYSYVFNFMYYMAKWDHQSVNSEIKAFLVKNNMASQKSQFLKALYISTLFTNKVHNKNATKPFEYIEPQNILFNYPNINNSWKDFSESTKKQVILLCLIFMSLDPTENTILYIAKAEKNTVLDSLDSSNAFFSFFDLFHKTFKSNFTLLLYQEDSINNFVEALRWFLFFELNDNSFSKPKSLEELKKQILENIDYLTENKI